MSKKKRYKIRESVVKGEFEATIKSTSHYSETKETITIHPWVRPHWDGSDARAVYIEIRHKGGQGKGAYDEMKNIIVNLDDLKAVIAGLELLR